MPHVADSMGKGLNKKQFAERARIRRDRLLAQYEKGGVTIADIATQEGFSESWAQALINRAKHERRHANDRKQA